MSDDLLQAGRELFGLALALGTVSLVLVVVYPPSPAALTTGGVFGLAGLGAAFGLTVAAGFLYLARRTGAASDGGRDRTADRDAVERPEEGSLPSRVDGEFVWSEDGEGVDDGTNGERE